MRLQQWWWQAYHVIQKNRLRDMQIYRQRKKRYTDEITDTDTSQRDIKRYTAMILQPGWRKANHVIPSRDGKIQKNFTKSRERFFLHETTTWQINFSAFRWIQDGTHLIHIKEMCRFRDLTPVPASFFLYFLSLHFLLLLWVSRRGICTCLY